MNNNERGSFTGKLGFVLAAAGASVGLGNIWRFPYLAAKYGGGIFLLVYVLLALTFGYTMIIAETSIGRLSQKSPVSAFRFFSDTPAMKFGGWINALIPILIVPYYSVIGGWVCRYLYEFLIYGSARASQDTFFTAFITCMLHQASSSDTAMRFHGSASSWQISRSARATAIWICCVRFMGHDHDSFFKIRD